MAGKPAVSMKDVAALAGVSLGTVSNVVNSPDRVAEPTRRRVESAIEKLGWITNESARQLRVGRSRAVGIVVMDIANPFFTDVIVGAETAVLERGFNVQVGNTAQNADRERAQLQLFAQQRVGGVLIAPTWGLTDAVRQLRDRGVPVVVLDRAGQQAELCSVSVDDVEGGRLAVAHLMDAGHEHIALVGGPASLQQVADRRLGGELAASAHGRVRLTTLATARLDVAAGLAAADEISGMPHSVRPTAAFAVNDLVAMGLLQGFVTAGMRVPEDVAIVGYDDIAFAAASAVPLSSVRQPAAQLGQRAAELLFEEIAAADHGAPHQHQQVRFQPELVVRRSSAARRSASSRTTTVET